MRKIFIAFGLCLAVWGFAQEEDSALASSLWEKSDNYIEKILHEFSPSLLSAARDLQQEPSFAHLALGEILQTEEIKDRHLRKTLDNFYAELWGLDEPFFREAVIEIQEENDLVGVPFFEVAKQTGLQVIERMLEKKYKKEVL